MSITEELREWWVRKFPVVDKELHENFTAIADRIDAEHQKAIRELNNLAEACELLPVDADGERIRVGDVMEWPTTGETFEVVGIGDGTLFYIEDGNELADWTGASTKRHHHAPTVEDVLREFTDAVIEWAGKSGTVAEVGTWSDVASDFIAKLQLREDA